MVHMVHVVHMVRDRAYRPSQDAEEICPPNMSGISPNKSADLLCVRIEEEQFPFASRD